MKKEITFKPEVLAPAGDAERAYLAAEAGADAVYFGLENLSARQAAINVKISELKNLIGDLHGQDVRSYITLNTILHDSELAQAKEYLLICEDAGANGVIIQDLSWLKLFATLEPNLELHASTQMNIHSDLDIKTAAELGFHRIVLPRETSNIQLALWSNLCQQLNLETEFFVHGALCMAISGRCQMSFFQGGRSANRGVCAQPCRLQYRLTDKNNSLLDKGALLSAKDQSLINAIPFFSKYKINSLKIEGRMKDAHYVKATVSSFRNAVDFWAEKKDKNLFEEFVAEEELKLLQVFNRGGAFTQRAFYLGDALNYVTKDFVGKHGILLGNIKKIKANDGTLIFDKNKFANNHLKKLKAKDQLAIRRKNKQIAVAPIGHVLENKGGISMKGFHPNKMRQMKIGDEIYLLSDADLEHNLQQMQRAKNDLALSLSINSDHLLIKAKASLHNSCVQYIFNYKLDKDILLENSLSEKRWTQQLSKTGNTMFTVKEVKYTYQDCDELPAIRVSEINRIRRKLIKGLREEIAFKHKTIIASGHYNSLKNLFEHRKSIVTDNSKANILNDTSGHTIQRKKLLSIINPERFYKLNELELKEHDQVEISMLFMGDFDSNQSLLNKLWELNPKLEILIRLPEKMHKAEEEIFRQLTDIYNSFANIGFSANGLSIINDKYYKGMLKHINEQANIINSESLSIILENTDCSISLSPEWNGQSLNSLLNNFSDGQCARIFIPKNYAISEMFMNYCPVGKNVKSCKKCITNEKALWSQSYDLQTLQKAETKHQLITYPFDCTSQIFTAQADNSLWDSLSQYNQSRLSQRESDFYFI